MGKDKATPGRGAASIAQAGRRESRTLPLLAKALLSTVLVGGLVAASSYALSDSWAKLGDDLTPSQARMRLEAFQALDSLVASGVSAEDTEKALQGMHLSQAALQSVRSDLQVDTPAHASTAPTRATDAAPVVHPLAQVQARSQRLKLMWIRLWDTNAEDGDVVRIDSGGYSRTVRLTKRGDTFAVPVPSDGVIRVTGIKDGDGGGITVGLASGSSQAVFPIMSEGQVLGLKVRVE